ncbi:hypothetical protein CIL05_05365 [Virgibacillus profundi]|uniref:Uncharacterized protein n=1 Tax=Virgibacillus profundi TaxID=2024555 RepID=A0A2A2IET9_9BACI|nr:hypothetical protein [Virgibacillus profundi]PAV30531.1 hypothetical protein CIL05_05365 [Virgibacillus profundi]PXY54703.1 hypothetical protein CIT14_05450 [Virgibacillus profundi]
MTKFNTSKNRKQEKKRIYSPIINNRDIPSPVIFPPPKINDQEVKKTEAITHNQSPPENKTKERKTSKLKKRKKRGFKSLNDLYYKYGGDAQHHETNRLSSSAQTEKLMDESLSFADKAANQKSGSEAEIDSLTRDKSSSNGVQNKQPKESSRNKEVFENGDLHLTDEENKFPSLEDEDLAQTSTETIINESISPENEEKDNDKESYINESEENRSLKEALFEEFSLVLEESLDSPNDFAETIQSKDETSHHEDEPSQNLLEYNEEAPLSHVAGKAASLADEAPPKIDEQTSELEKTISKDKDHSLQKQFDGLHGTIKKHNNDHEKINTVNKLVKLPVLLANINFDVDIIQTIDSACPIESITNIDWSIESLITHVLPSANTVFLKGILVADIEYVSEQTIHTLKIPIYWDKVVQVDWINSPEQSKELLSEYTFGSSDQDFSTHLEFSKTFTEPIEDDLQSIHFIWHNELDSKSFSSKVSVQGTANLSINLLQKLYVNVFTKIDKERR